MLGVTAIVAVVFAWLVIYAISKRFYMSACLDHGGLLDECEYVFEQTR